ncbi:polymorphic toxin-type HINT domain-containing protein [Streptomyces sp. NPDC056401]|uniref:polymorphic toxin-type HINT domain-containing protein n=1 Tax=Streptomyces sp. NPDC056401 TaxID=3345809 RepID=UPI0035D5CE6D
MSPFSANNFRLPGTRAARARRARLAGRAGVALSVMLVVTLLPNQAWAAPPGGRDGVELPELQKDVKTDLDKPEAAKLMAWEPASDTPLEAYEPLKTTPPTGGAANVALAGVTGDQLVKAGALPVSIGKASPTEVDPTPANPTGTWSVAVEPRASTEAKSVDGAIIKVTPPAAGSTPVDVELDYKQFKDLYGTEWATRLTLKQLPACFLDNPDLPECNTAKDIPSINDPVTGTVRATVDPAATLGEGPQLLAGAATVLKAVGGASGPSGTYKATPLSPSGSWTAGGSGGGFSWSYPLNIPAPPAGPAPKIAFSYSSQAVDGKTSVANGQASWIGDGWGYEPGFIERRYRSCSDDSKATAAGKANNDNTKDKNKGDLCWAGDSLTMSLSGSSTELVHDDATDKWVPATDDGSKVELITPDSTDPAARNGAMGGEYWVVTTREGTRYFFGRHDVDGAGTRAVTNSVFTVPVFGNHPGDPCYKPAFADSSCGNTQQAWRWNLDYVEDVHGNAMIIDWAKETNYYPKNGSEKASTAYTRGGYPKQITYGLRSDNLSGAPAGKVAFAVEERCIKEGSTSCSDSEFESKNFLDKQPWWDTPTNLNCKKDSAHCPTGSPTFWTRKRLDTVTTSAQRTPGSTALSLVDQWALKQSFPSTRTETSPPLWLESITRTGYGAVPVKDADGNQLGTQLPAVTFVANKVDMPNRVKTSTDPKQDAAPAFDRLRIEVIRNETGGETYVDYSAPCPIGVILFKPEENSSRCFPSHWSADGSVKQPPLEWFNKYVVEKVIEKDRVARQPDVTTSYTYEGKAAWAKEDDEFSKPELRTYNQWRGYESVVVKKGVTANTGKPNATEQSQTRTRYFRGMSGDAGRPAITVKDSTGAETLGVDLPQYQGTVAESITYTKAGGTVASRVLSWPGSDDTATRLRPGTTPLVAYRTHVSRSDTIETISGGATRRVRTLNSTPDTTYGLIDRVQNEVIAPDGTGGWNATEQTCAATYYVHNPTAHLIGLPWRVRTTAGDCSSASTSTGTVLADTRTAYDALGAFNTAPVKGLAYQVDTLNAAGTGWIASARTQYDALGRPVKVTDAANNSTTTSYSPATGTVFSVTSTNALGHKTTTTNDPGRGVPLESTDANGGKVTTSYDDLGRVTAVRTPSQKATDKAAYTFSYQLDPGKTPVVTTGTLRDNGTYAQSVSIYDGLLRPRQTQTEAMGGGRLITDTLYSANGTVWQTHNGYLAEGEPKKEFFVPESLQQIPNSTQTAYDGLGRAVRTTTLYGGIAQHSATAQYEGDWTLTRTAMSVDGATPLEGSRASKTWTDALGRTSLIQNASAADLTIWRNTTYSYDARNKLSKVTDPAGNEWTYTYDMRGRMTGSDDPDMGAVSFGYDNLDQQTWTKDSAGRTQYTTYDPLGRKTELRDDAADGPLVSEWTFDTLPGAKGYPVASTRYNAGAAYTSEITDYDTEYRPTGSKVTIPDTAATKGLAGTYAYSTTYTPTGKVQSTTVPATPGGLAAEKLITRYNADGAPVTMSGLSWYTADTVYSPYGEVLRTTSGDAPQKVWQTNLYNPNTGQMAQSIADRQTGPHRISDVQYAYDPAGNITSVTDSQPGGRVETQCFVYDPMGQLTRAWTGKTKACNGPTRSDVTAGPDGDGYWQDYLFDRIGNRTKIIERDLSGADLDDWTMYYYGVEVTGNGTQAPTKTQPHALTKTEETTNSPGSTIISQSTYGYDNAGNTTRRTIGGDTQVLKWDRNNKLTSASSPGIGSAAVTGLSGKCLDVEGDNGSDGAQVQVWSCKETKDQQWRLSGETVQVLGKCLKAAGAAAVLATCDGSDEQKFTHRSDKTLYNAKAQACLTVPNDSATDGNDLDIYKCLGTPAQQWNFATTATTYLYDAAGNRLIEETGTSRTLYLGEAEFTVNKAGQPIDAVRYYGNTVRSTRGKTTDHKLSIQLTDHHNTATTSIDQSSSQAITRRKFDPYGNERGAQVGWAGSRTFLGTGNNDSSTGLTHIGAREYEPGTGRFISVDPIIDITDPLQMNGYTYANANPITNSDPTGLKLDDGTGHSEKADGTPPANPFTPGGGHKGDSGSGDGPGTNTGSSGKGSGGSKATKGCGNWLCTGWKKTKAFVVEHKVAIVSIATEVVVGAACVAGATAAGVATGGAGFALAAGCGAVAGAAGAAVANLMDPNADHSVMGVLKDTVGGAVVGAIGGVAGAGAAVAAKAVAKGAKNLVAKITGGGKGGTCPVPNSFTAGSLVLMADGTTKPIEKIENGDKVQAADPETGETAPKAVTATIQGEGSKNLVEITVDTDGDTGPASDIITATDGHPFWVVEIADWVDAKDLRPGQWLQTSSGTLVKIESIERWTEQSTKVYNLTVADVHTYYVLAGATPVLVHNCNVTLTQREANTLRIGPHADDLGPVPATGPAVTPGQSAAMQGRVCHSCGETTPVMTGDHQPSSGIGPTSLPRSLFPHCETCSDIQSVAVSKAQQMLRNHGYHDPTFEGLPGIPSAAQKLAELLPSHTR